MKHDRFESIHYSVSLPSGDNQDNVPDLLRRLAQTIEDDNETDVMDIVIVVDELDINGNFWPSATVYGTLKDENGEYKSKIVS